MSASSLDQPFDPRSAEPRIYAAWEASGAFRAREDDSRGTFSICIPPPNVTGSLHIGHALDNTLQDILVRYHRMLGKSVLWQVGTDHAGIATQMVVERKLEAEGKPRKSMSRGEFLNHVWDWKSESGGRIIEQLKRLGASADWSREKFTMGDPDDSDDTMAMAVRKAFVDLYEKGLIYRDKRLVNWDPHFQTAISDLEVENREVDGHFWHFKYPLEGGETYTYEERDADGNVTLSEERDYIAIATTRPETMLGDGAVAVHPDDARYAPIVGKLVRLPLADRLIPIITDEYPDPDFGSGAVKITGAHDFNDYEVAKRNDIPMYPLMGTRGEMIASEIMPDKYVGMDRFAARKAVVADIDAQGLLIRVEDKKIMQPFGDRSGVVIEPMLTDQWYVDAMTLAKPAIEAVERGDTSFVPANWKKTYDHWMGNIQPWCISRQLWWGHRIPAWFMVGEESLFVVAETLSEAEELARQQLLDTEVMDHETLSDFVSENGKVVGGIYTQDTDVLDTWFSAALWPFSTLGWPADTPELDRFYPTSALVTGFDIIFFWVARMMMFGLEFTEKVPFRDVFIHGLVLDETGKKMSKSEGNVIDPLDLIDGIGVDALVEKRTTGLRQPERAPKVAKATRKQYPDGFEPYGADALRMTLAAMTGQGRNLRLSVEKIVGNRNFGTKLWNAARFLRMNACAPVSGFNPTAVEQPLNRWIVGEASDTIRTTTQALEAYRFSDAADAVYKFAWGTFCDWYIEFSKPVLNGGDAAEKSETQATAAWTLDTILRLLHPFMPFITEELWALTGERDAHLILSDWPEPVAMDADTSEVARLEATISAIRSVRSEMNVPPSRKAALIVVGETDAFFGTYADILSQMARVSDVEFADAVPSGALTTVVDGLTLAIPLAGLIDLDAERARLDAATAKARAEIEKIDRKLANPKFTERAPAAVVEEQRTRREGYATEVAKLEAAMAALG